MNTPKSSVAGLTLALLATFTTFSWSQLSTFAQGALTPPGAPAATMKTLDQIEARRSIGSAPFSIFQPGSYYLTTNLTVSSNSAISIFASDVTVDLNGFTVSSTASSPEGDGIAIIGNVQNVTVENGFIEGGVTNDGNGVYSGHGFASGIVSPQPVENVRVLRVTVSGVLNYGIFLPTTPNSTLVESCTLRTVGGNGVLASVVRSTVVLDCGLTAISGNQVSDCYGESTGAGNGLDADTADNCYGESSSGAGVWVKCAHNCYGVSSSGAGLQAYTANNCFGQSSGGYGLHAYAANCCHGISDDNEGVFAADATGCSGSSTTGNGLTATTARDCKGQSDSGYGLYAGIVAIGCVGSSSSGTGLYAVIGNSCLGQSTSGTAESIVHGYNNPP